MRFEIYYAIPKRSGILGKRRRVFYHATSRAAAVYELHFHHPEAIVLCVYYPCGTLGATTSEGL